MTDHENSFKNAVRQASCLADKCELVIFGSRWLLYPINLGLMVALAVYVCKFTVDVFLLVVSSFHSDTEVVRVLVLGLVDTAMVANLLVMIYQGSHQIFIRRIKIDDHTNRPQWLDHIDSGILKVKVALSISGIMLVQLLKDYVDLEKLKWEVVVHRVELLGVSLIAALIMAIIWRVTHPSEPGHAGDHGKSLAKPLAAEPGNGEAAAHDDSAHGH